MSYPETQKMSKSSDDRENDKKSRSSKGKTRSKSSPSDSTSTDERKQLNSTKYLKMDASLTDSTEKSEDTRFFDEKDKYRGERNSIKSKSESQQEKKSQASSKNR